MIDCQPYQKWSFTFQNDICTANSCESRSFHPTVTICHCPCHFPFLFSILWTGYPAIFMHIPCLVLCALSDAMSCFLVTHLPKGLGCTWLTPLGCHGWGWTFAAWEWGALFTLYVFMCIGRVTMAVPLAKESKLPRQKLKSLRWGEQEHLCAGCATRRSLLQIYKNAFLYHL